MFIWGSEKSGIFIEKSFHLQYVIVWCAISAQVLIRPYFSKIQMKKKLSFNQSNYQNMIENYFIPELSNKVGNNFDEQIFMLAHPLIQLKNYRIIGERIISNLSLEIWFLFPD
jgi:hypothetical protein